MNKKLYWTDAEENDIEVYDPNTAHRKVLIRTGLGSESIPRAIVLDPATRFCFCVTVISTNACMILLFWK